MEWYWLAVIGLVIYCATPIVLWKLLQKRINRGGMELLLILPSFFGFLWMGYRLENLFKNFKNYFFGGLNLRRQKTKEVLEEIIKDNENSYILRMKRCEERIEELKKEGDAVLLKKFEDVMREERLMIAGTLCQFQKLRGKSIDDLKRVVQTDIDGVMDCCFESPLKFWIMSIAAIFGMIFWPLGMVVGFLFAYYEGYFN